MVAPPGCPSGDSIKTKEFFHYCRQSLLTVGIIRDAVGGKCSRDASLVHPAQGASVIIPVFLWCRYVGNDHACAKLLC